MIALGIAPGLQALAYSVLSYPSGAKQAELLDADTLRAGRAISPAASLDLMRRFRAHSLILDVVLDRHPPAIIVLGPPANPHEAPEAIGVVRLALFAIGQTFGVRVLDLGDPKALYAALGVSQSRALTGEFRDGIAGDVVVPRDKRILVATAAAIAGARMVRKG